MNAPAPATHAARRIRVFAKILTLNIRACLAYRMDFWTSIAFGVLWQTSTLAFASVLLLRFHRIGGFTGSGVLLIIGMRLLSHGVYVVLFDNLAFLSNTVDDGRFDSYLMRPLSVLLQVLTSRFNVNGLGDLAVGATTCALAVAAVEVSWGISNILFLLAAILGGTFLEAGLQLLLACLVLRSPGTHILGTWVDELMSTFGNYPLSILPGPVEALLTFVLPLAFVSYLPARALLGLPMHGGLQTVVARCSPLVGIGLFLLACQVWSATLRHYRSVGG